MPLRSSLAYHALMPVKPRPATKRPAREDRDRRFVMLLSGIFAGGALVVMGMNVADSNRNSRAREALGVTFVRMHSRQAEFRSVNGRFATWPELRDNGVSLGPRQSVVDSNADASHWFLSIRDRETGVVCDRTGELLDGPIAERLPVCRDSKAD